MPDGDAAVFFVFDYELSVDDVREAGIVGRSAARRAKSLVSLWALPVISLVLAVVTIVVNEKTAACFIPNSTPSQAPLQILVWQCHPTSPNDLLWQNVWLFSAAGAVWVLTLIDLAKAWVRPPRWFLPRWMKMHGLQGRYRYEVAADGFTTASPDGTISYIPWPVFIAVRETPERFFLFGPQYKVAWVLPKRALSGRSPVQQLGQFLRASVGPDAPS
jgi:hypothetical protein